MTLEKFKRKLTAILSADVKGYSRLMGEDEEGTIRTLNAYMEVIAGFIQQHRGRVVATGGDSVLAEFASVVDAARCAVGIQEELKDRNKELPEEKRMEFRIGINLGDVVEEGENILGDGVNVAARVQSVAEAGGIYISGTVYDQIRNKLAFRYDFIGEQAVKNIKEPVRVYRVRLEPEVAFAELGQEKRWVGKRLSKTAMVIMAVIVIAVGAILYQFVLRQSSKTEVASKEKMAFPLPDKPSIAILPFTNMSDDPKQEYFAAGLAEEIINALSKLPQVFVIARNSTFTYKGKAIDVKQVSREMGVQYVLEGSVRREGNRVRITAQLIDVITGNHVFSERYERELQDLFAIQDDVTAKIMTAMRVKLTHGEQDRMLAKGTKNLEAYLKFLQSREHREIVSKESQALARQLAEEAIALDPGYAMAYSAVASAIGNEVWAGVYKNPKEALERAIELVEKAISIDESLAFPHIILSFLSMTAKRDYGKGIAEAERAVALEPNSADAYTQLGISLSWAGRPAEAIPVLRKAMRLSPIPPARCLYNMAACYRVLGQYEEAIAIYMKILQKQPDQMLARLGLAATLILANKEEEARAQAAELLRIDPKFSLDSYAKTLAYRDQTQNDKIVNALRKAGLK